MTPIYKAVPASCALAAVVTVGFCATIVYGADAIMDVDAWAVALTTVLGAVMLVCVVVVFLQPQSKAHLFFKVLHRRHGRSEDVTGMLACCFVSVSFYLFYLSSTRHPTYGQSAFDKANNI